MRNLTNNQADPAWLCRLNYAFTDDSEKVLDRNLYVTEQLNSTIRKVVVATGEVTTLAGTAGMSGSADGIGPDARFISPRGVAVDNTGNLYVADRGSHTIRKVVVATGVVTTLAGAAVTTGSGDGIGAAARFSSPSGVALDNAGNLYISDAGNNAVRHLLLATNSVTTVVGVSGQIKVQTGLLPAGLNQPQAVATLPTGGLVILDENSVLWAR